MWSAHSKRESERSRRKEERKEGKKAGPKQTPGTLAPLTTKLKDRCNSHFTHERK